MTDHLHLVSLDGSFFHHNKKNTDIKCNFHPKVENCSPWVEKVASSEEKTLLPTVSPFQPLGQQLSTI